MTLSHQRMIGKLLPEQAMDSFGASADFAMGVLSLSNVSYRLLSHPTINVGVQSLAMKMVLIKDKAY